MGLPLNTIKHPTDTTGDVSIEAKYAFFHANGKLLAGESFELSESKILSSHIMFTRDILTKSIPYCATQQDVDAFIAANPGILTFYNKKTITPIPLTNNQAWYIEDNGWKKPIITESIAQDPVTGNPSLPFTPILYDSSGNAISATAGVWWLDPYSGVIKFGNGYTPQDKGWGSTPKISCYVYTGPTLLDYVTGTDAKEFVYISTLPSTTHTIAHNLASFNLETTVYAFDDGAWTQQIAKLSHIDDNNSVLYLSEALNVRVTFRKIN